MWCWGCGDSEAVAEFEQLLQVFAAVSIDVSDPRHVHRAVAELLGTAAAQVSDGRGNDTADLAVDALAVVFDVVA